MSNPYDPYPGNGDQTQPPPYGDPIQSGGGGGYPPSPYGSAPGGYGAPAPRTDGLSITAFVLSLTCVLSVVGLILGFIGLSRTKNNQRKGRWAAVAAIPIGIIGTLALVGGIIFVVYIADHVITPDNAKVGQCADVTDKDNEISLFRKDCTSEHDAEIVVVETKGNSTVGTNEQEICEALLSDDYAAVLADLDVDYRVASEDPESANASDRFICYVTPAVGQFDKPLLP